jgi:hypothetical protein
MVELSYRLMDLWSKDERILRVFRGHVFSTLHSRERRNKDQKKRSDFPDSVDSACLYNESLKNSYHYITRV